MTELSQAEIDAIGGAKLTVGEAAGITAGIMVFGGPVGIAVGVTALLIYAWM